VLSAVRIGPSTLGSPDASPLRRPSRSDASPLPTLERSTGGESLAAAAMSSAARDSPINRRASYGTVSPERRRAAVVAMHLPAMPSGESVPSSGTRSPSPASPMASSMSSFPVRKLGGRSPLPARSDIRRASTPTLSALGIFGGSAGSPSPLETRRPIFATLPVPQPPAQPVWSPAPTLHVSVSSPQLTLPMPQSPVPAAPVQVQSADDVGEPGQQEAPADAGAAPSVHVTALSLPRLLDAPSPAQLPWQQKLEQRYRESLGRVASVPVLGSASATLTPVDVSWEGVGMHCDDGAPDAEPQEGGSPASPESPVPPPLVLPTAGTPLEDPPADDFVRSYTSSPLDAMPVRLSFVSLISGG
jgi:hypothetical protein